MTNLLLPKLSLIFFNPDPPHSGQNLKSRSMGSISPETPELVGRDAFHLCRGNLGE